MHSTPTNDPAAGITAPDSLRSRAAPGAPPGQPDRTRTRSARSFRVAMVAACPFPANYGSPGAIREMSESLSSMGHEVHIVTYPLGEKISVIGPKIWRCRRWRESKIYSGPSLEKIILDLFLLIQLCIVIRREKIEVIHAHNYEGVLIGLAAKLVTRRPVLYNAVNLMSDELHTYRFLKPIFLAKWFAGFLDWFIARMPDGFIAITEDLQRALLKRGAPPERMALVPCGVKLDMFEKPDAERFRARYEIGHRPVVMYTGITCRLQRIDYLLRAFSVVLKKVPDAVLMVVSPLANDPDIPANQALAESLDVSDSTIFVQGQTLAELPDYLAVAAVAVMSRPDVPGHPIKLLNYMAAAKPIVCFTGAAKGVHHLHDAYLVPDHDWSKLGEGIITLLEDRELALRLGSKARQTVLTDFDWITLCLKVERLYMRLTDRKQDPDAESETSARISPAIEVYSGFREPEEVKGELAMAQVDAKMAVDGVPEL